MAAYGRCKVCRDDFIWGFNPATKRRIPLVPGRLSAENVPKPNLAISRDHLGSLLVRPLRKGDEPLPNEWWGLAHQAVCSGKRPATRVGRRKEGRR